MKPQQQELSRWMRYSRGIDWPQRGRATVAGLALISFWVLVWRGQEPGGPGRMACGWAIVFSAFALFCAIAETQRSKYDVDLVSPPLSLWQVLRRHEQELKLAPLKIVAVALWLVVYLVGTVLAMVVIVAPLVFIAWELLPHL